MGETKWTKEQLAAIETRNCNLLIAAAAGSGKTAVLVERIIRIITNEEAPVDIDRLLVVTFTSAAASEMRERIAIAITKALESNPNSKNLQKQLTLLSRANITTMHSFCLDVIKNNFHIVEMDPGFRILDETEATLLKSEILEDLFEDKYEEGREEFLRLIEAYSGSRDDEKLKNIILDLYSFSMSGPWPEKWLKEKSEEFNLKSKEELLESKWVEILKENLMLELLGIINMEERAKGICEEVTGLEPYIETLDSDLYMLRDVYDSLNGSLDDIYLKLSSLKFSRIKTLKKGTVEDTEAKDTVKAIRDDAKKKVSKLQEDTFSFSPNEMLESIKQVYPYMRELTSLVIEFEHRFSKAKRAKGTVDFNDLEHLCLTILNNKEFNVSEYFKEYFDEVLVDEYQDSNSVQEAIIDLVSRKYGEDPNVFMVGDVKQSIYRFRQAKPELFLDKYINYSKDEGKNRKVQLYKNFRSRYEVITGVNFIFRELMSKFVGELDYTDEEALNLGADYKALKEDEEKDAIVGGNVELHILDRASEISVEEKDIDEEEENIEYINLEARIVARRIRELVSPVKGEKIFNVLDKVTGQYRPVTYKDIVILLRATKKWSEVFLDELGAEGIPVYADTGSGYFESIEIRTIISLLKVIDNPLQDVPLIALLRSPITNFYVEEVADIRLYNGDNYFYENISLIAENDSFDNEVLRDKCKTFIEKLEVWREKSVYTPIDEFIWYLYMDTAYYGYVGAMPNGVLRQANLKILFQRAKQYEETSFKGLFNFINFINKLRKSTGDMGSAKILGENEDVVRIMSIHKSKGLEFPVVFLSGSGKQFNLMDLNKSILYHEELGLGPDLINLEKRISHSTLPKEAIKQRIKRETLSEEMRILYVAFTRAKEKLIITGAASNLKKWAKTACARASLGDDKILSSEVFKAKSYLEWIGMALARHKDGEEIRTITDTKDITIKLDESSWSTRFYNSTQLLNFDNDEAEEEEKESPILTSKCNSVNGEIIRRLGFTYRYKEATVMSSNFSVSDLKKRNQEAVEIEEDITNLYKEKVKVKPKFLQEKVGLSAAEKGTAMHFAMQRIDLSRVSSLDEIKEQLKELVHMELLSKEEYKSIKANKILNFFKSNLGKRMLRAYERGDKIYKELPFYTEIDPRLTDPTLSSEVKDEKVRLQGVIDCFFYEGDKIILLDYKTDYVQAGDEDKIIQRYSIQIDYYRDALKKIVKKEVEEAYLYLFALDKEVKIN